MAFKRDNVKSPTFEIEGVDMEQSLNKSFDSFSGLDIDTGSFKNTARSLKQTNQDGRVPLGMFYFKDDNVFQDNLPDIINEDLFKQIQKPNLVQNGDCKYIQNTYVSTISKESGDGADSEKGIPLIFKPQGGWTFMNELGVAPPIVQTLGGSSSDRIGKGGTFRKARLEKRLGDNLFTDDDIYEYNQALQFFGFDKQSSDGGTSKHYFLNEGQLTSCVVRLEKNQSRRSFLGDENDPGKGEVLFLGRIYYQDEEKTIKSSNDGVDVTNYYTDYICHQVEILSPHLNQLNDDGSITQGYHLVDLQQHAYGDNQHGTVLTPAGDDGGGGSQGFITNLGRGSIYLMVVDKRYHVSLANGGDITEGPTHDSSGYTPIPTQYTAERSIARVEANRDYGRDGQGFQKSIVPVSFRNNQWWYIRNADSLHDYDDFGFDPQDWYNDNYDATGSYIGNSEEFSDDTPYPERGPIPQEQLNHNFIFAKINAFSRGGGIDSINHYGVMDTWRESTTRNYPQIQTDFPDIGSGLFETDKQNKSGFSGFYSYAPIPELGTYYYTNNQFTEINVKKEIFIASENMSAPIAYDNQIEQSYYSDLDDRIGQGHPIFDTAPSGNGFSVNTGCVPPIAAWVKTEEAFSNDRCLVLKNDITWNKKLTSAFDKFEVANSIDGSDNYTFYPFGGGIDYNISAIHYPTSFGYIVNINNSTDEIIYPGGNQYRSLNQIQKIYDRDDRTIRAFSSLKVSFMMKTYQVYEQNHNIFINDVDPSTYGNHTLDTLNLKLENPSFEQMPCIEAGIPLSNGRSSYNENTTVVHHHPQVSYGDFNSFSYGKRTSDSSVGSRFGGIHKFKNTQVGVWEKMEFTFNLANQHEASAGSGIVEDLYFSVAASSNGIDENGNLEQFIATVLIDNIEVIESYDFSPDVDVRKKKSANEYGKGDLTKYYDKNISEQLEAYNDTTAPLEAQFYFYPRYPTDEIFDEQRSVIYNDFKNGMFYIYDVDWGDGSINEFTDEPKQIDEKNALYHTYETSGVFEVSGYMLRMKPDADYIPIGVAHTKRFKLKINVNEGFDEEFNYFGGNGFSFIPYKNTSPIIGGISKQSSYYKTINRQLGFLTDDEKTNVDFQSEGNQLKTELALIKMDDNVIDGGNLEVGQYYLQPRNTNKDDSGEEVFTGLGALAGELGKSIGDCDLTHIKYYTTPKSIFELFGFSKQEAAIVGNSDSNNRRYWRNIIPQNYSIFNRDGIELDTGLQQPVLKSYITAQDWLDTNYYYPVLPRYSANGSFINNSFPNNKIPWPLNGPITDESEVSEELLFHITSNNISSDAINDETGNNNYGFTISDYKPIFDNETLTPQKVKRFKKIKSTTVNGAF